MPAAHLCAPHATLASYFCVYNRAAGCCFGPSTGCPCPRLQLLLQLLLLPMLLCCRCEVAGLMRSVSLRRVHHPALRACPGLLPYLKVRCNCGRDSAAAPFCLAWLAGLLHIMPARSPCLHTHSRWLPLPAAAPATPAAAGRAAAGCPRLERAQGGCQEDSAEPWRSSGHRQAPADLHPAAAGGVAAAAGHRGERSSRAALGVGPFWPASLQACKQEGWLTGYKCSPSSRAHPPLKGPEGCFLHTPNVGTTHLLACRPAGLWSAA